MNAACADSKEKTPGKHYLAGGLLQTFWIVLIASVSVIIAQQHFQKMGTINTFLKQEMEMNLRHEHPPGRSGRAVNWPRFTATNAKASICSRLRIRTLLHFRTRTFIFWLYITQPESQSLTLQVTNQSQSLSVGEEEGKQGWNGQEQLVPAHPLPLTHPSPAHEDSTAERQSWRPQGV